MMVWYGNDGRSTDASALPIATRRKRGALEEKDPVEDHPGLLCLGRF